MVLTFVGISSKVMFGYSIWGMLAETIYVILIVMLISHEQYIEECSRGVNMKSLLHNKLGTHS